MKEVITDTGAEKIHLAKQFLTGLRTRDANLLRSIMKDDATWTLPGHGLVSGEAKGIDAVIQRAQTIAGYGLTFTLTHVLIGAHGVALSLHNTARRGEVIFDQHLATVLTLEGEKVSAINTYLENVEMLNTFFVPV